ncbi:MAG: 1,4-alpha-glucan branching protein GlgB [Clostridia bacterium]|nr:1,4-alpha-glucan branching protein GlgB [Clostridia bacterium]
MEQLQNYLRQFHNEVCERSYSFMGCHPCSRDQQDGFVFRVWAPQANAVSVVGDFNFWNEDDLPMRKISDGVWEVFSVYAKAGQAYKFCVTGRNGKKVYKSDPYARRFAKLPDTSGIIEPPEEFRWHDAAYRKKQQKQNALSRPVNIYEVHAGSWKRHEDGSYYSYEDLAEELVPYVKAMGYTHIELLPIMEHPYDPSWGYQVTGYYAPTHRYGTPRQFMQFVDDCHRAGLGVILDWVPAHFPKDENGLYEFDGTCCYELSDPQMREHPDWGTRIYDYAKPEVRSFLISNACYWLDVFHVDGIRVDAVASMLYLDYNRTEYKPNRFGGRENLEAIEFLRQLNSAAFRTNPAVMMIAEESTTFPLITKPDYDGGLGFLFKWNMGWMNDMLKYMALDPLFRKGDHNALTFSMTYAFSENFVLPLSHDEVVYGKRSLISKMPGSYEDQFNNLRAFFAFQMAHPGKKLNFMGSEFAQFSEWDYKNGLDWLLLDYEKHRQMQAFVRELNRFYLKTKALWENDSDWDGFRWLSCDDCDNSIVAFRRIDRRGRELIAVCNFCPVLRENYELPLPRAGWYVPVFNTDDKAFGGYGFEAKTVHAGRKKWGQYSHAGRFTVPPMSVTYYVHQHTNPERNL